MSPEEKQDLLKNCLVKRVQKDPSWASPVEDAVRDGLRRTVSAWLKAAEVQGIGPKEVVEYLKDINEYITNKKVVEQPPQESGPESSTA